MSPGGEDLALPAALSEAHGSARRPAGEIIVAARAEFPDFQATVAAQCR